MIKYKFLNRLKEKGFYSKFEKEGFEKIDPIKKGYYYLDQLIENSFNFDNLEGCNLGSDFIKKYDLNTVILNNGLKSDEIVFLEFGFYDFKKINSMIEKDGMIYNK